MTRGIGSHVCNSLSKRRLIERIWQEAQDPDDVVELYATAEEWRFFEALLDWTPSARSEDGAMAA